MTVDPILALQSLGYTEREASFLYLVGIHSGYFLRRQFDFFIDRKMGYLVHHFTEKARIAGHIEVLDYGQRFFVYHLIAKPIYRLLGDGESQNRRRKGDAAVRIRLMMLDYVLENNDDHYLETSAAKLHYFTEMRRIPTGLLVGASGRMSSFLESYPVSVANREHPESSLVRFAFLDEGLFSAKKFARFLNELVPLFHAIRRFEVIYVATSEQNFSEAKMIFGRRFADPTRPRQQSFDGFRESSSQRRLSVRPPLDGTFATLLLGYSYPKLLRNEARSSAQSSGIELPRKGAIA